MTSSAEPGDTAGGVRGSRVVRREDPALITGQARYADDIQPRGLLHAAILRSQYGHARITGVDTSEAEALAGVATVLVAEDLEADDIGTVPTFGGPPAFGPTMSVHDGPNVPERPLLARDRVRYTGEAIAVVVAEDRYTANDAVDRIEVEYDRLDAVVDAPGALEDGAPELHKEAPGNLAFVWEVGDESATSDAFNEAPNTVSLDLVNRRLAPNSLEPRGVVADYDAIEETLAVHVSTQAPHDHRQLFANVLGLPEQKVRVEAPAVGGGFGIKNKYFAGELLAGWAAVRLGRPVKWTATRTEAFRTDTHGRGHHTTAELAFDDDGTIVGLRADSVADLGAYLSKVGAFIPTANYATLLSGQYTIPAVHARVTGVYTNAAPTDAYRGGGRPEACYVVERLVQRAAAELDIDPAEFRRRNYIQPDDFPYESPVDAVYDSGDYEPALDRALELADYDAYRRRQSELRESGRYVGIGIGSLVESAGTAQAESGLVRFHPSGTVSAYVGTFDTGQGHATSFAQILADELGVPYEDIEVVDGNTEEIPAGTGTFGSRSAIAGGNALAKSAQKVIESARPIAAHHLESGVEDIEFSAGAFHVAGAPDRSISIQEVARRAYAGEVPDGSEWGLEATTFIDPVTTYPFGTHVAVVEVDPETGDIDLLRYAAVDDCGEQLNPMIVEGQVIGGVAQGLGQARLEGVEYDDNGNLVSGSFQDYAMPRAHDIPDLLTDHTVTPSPRNDLGVKGTGEAGTIAAPPAFVNAVVDALAPLGVEHLDMPLTDEAVWRAMQDARPD